MSVRLVMASSPAISTVLLMRMKIGLEERLNLTFDKLDKIWTTMFGATDSDKLCMHRGRQTSMAMCKRKL